MSNRKTGQDVSRGAAIAGPLLEGKGLCKVFGKGDRCCTALDRIDFTLAPGEILGVVGESGSGKSTLLKIVAGLETPDGGELLYKGKPLGAKRTKEDYRAIQMVFQSAKSSFNPRRTVRSSLKEVAKNLGSVRPLDELLASVGLDPDLAARYPSGISGGQCQRMAIARAIMPGPDLLLCDEITSALDVSVQAQILALLARLRKETGMAMLFVTHDLSVAGSICDRIMVLHDGRFVECGPARQVLSDPQEAYTKMLLSTVLEV